MSKLEKVMMKNLCFQIMTIKQDFYIITQDLYLDILPLQALAMLFSEPTLVFPVEITNIFCVKMAQFGGLVLSKTTLINHGTCQGCKDNINPVSCRGCEDDINRVS